MILQKIFNQEMIFKKKEDQDNTMEVSPSSLEPRGRWGNQWNFFFKNGKLFFRATEFCEYSPVQNST